MQEWAKSVLLWLIDFCRKILKDENVRLDINSLVVKLTHNLVIISYALGLFIF